MPESRSSRANFKILLLLSFGHLATDIYQGALPAILPFLKAKLSLSYTLAGFLLMAANVTSSLIQPLFGYLSDKREKALLLPLGCLAAGLGLSLLSLPASYETVLLFVVLSGCGIAAYHPEGYKTAHFFTGSRMATGMMVFSVGGNLGLALGPIIALAVITWFGFDGLPVMVLFSLLFLVLLGFTWHPLSRAAALPQRAPRQNPVRAPAGTYLALFLVIAIVMLRSWLQLGLMTYLPFYVIDFLHGEPLYAGQLVSVFLLGGVVGTVGGSVLADRWGLRTYLRLSLLGTTIIFPLLFCITGPLLYPLLGILGMVLISTFTVTIVMAQQLLPRNLGVASGLMVGFAIGAGGLGVTVLGLVADNYGVFKTLQAMMLLPPVALGLSLAIRRPQSP